jgi:hypothetical protein
MTKRTELPHKEKIDHYKNHLFMVLYSILPLCTDYILAGVYYPKAMEYYKSGLESVYEVDREQFSNLNQYEQAIMQAAFKSIYGEEVKNYPVDLNTMINDGTLAQLAAFMHVCFNCGINFKETEK